MRDDQTHHPLESQLSAFLDGELPENETELLIRRLERDGLLQKALARYALIGEVMRTPAGAHSVTVSRDFAARVSAAIGANPPAAARPPAARWLKPAAGLSIAAGVGALAITLFTEPRQQPVVATATAPAAQAEAPAASSVAAEASYIVPEIPVTGPLVPAARLTNYVMAHSEYSSPLGRRNVLSGMLADETTDGTAPAGFVPVSEATPADQP